MAALADGLRRNRSLRNLLLWDDYADKRGIGMIGEALAANALLPLEELVIFGQAIDDHRVAAAIVEGISMQRNLQSISLFNLYLDDESMRELADALHGHDALTNIQLSHCARSCYSITPLLRRIAHNELPSLKRLLLQGAIADGEACALELAAVLKPKGQSDWSGCTAWNVEKLERSLVASKRCGRA